jgi:uncharacterized membrane protein HdeD (DUF308 family)
MTAQAERIYGVPSTLHHKWGWIVALGVLFLIAGFFALTDELAATVVSIYATGLAMIATGIMEIITGIQIRPWSRALFWALVGVAMLAGGVLIFRDPLLAAAGFTMALGVCLVVAGLFRLILAFQIKDANLWVMVALSGFLSFIVGVLILSQWPVSSLYVIGLLLGVNLIFIGASWLSLGLTLRPGANA